MLESVWYYSRRSNICLSVCPWKIKRPAVHAVLTTVMSTSVRPCEGTDSYWHGSTEPAVSSSRPDRQKCHPAFCIFHTTDRSTDHSSVLGILCTVIIINLILSRYRLFISITGSKCGKRKRQYFRNRCETWNGISLASVTDMFTIHLFNNPISVHNRYGLPKPIGNSPIKSAV